MKNKEKLLNIVIVFLSVAIVVTAFAVFNEYMSYKNMDVHTEEEFFINLSHQDYDTMVWYMYSNEASGVTPTRDMKNMYAVARYYEAAFLYKAYAENGDTTAAEEKKQIMDEQVSLMGEFSYAKADIDTLLGLVE